MDKVAESAWKVLANVMDPEVPVISVVDLGIVREITNTQAGLLVTVTPTYSGCPATALIEDSIRTALNRNGFQDVMIKTSFLPAWTTDWISKEGKEKLKNYGIAPPGKVSESLVGIGKKRPNIPCPFCNSDLTKLKSEFGSTACKALYVCSACKQPFEHFKAI